jgi:hypothetical protein
MAREQAAGGTADRVFGIVGGTMLLLAAFFLVRSFLPGGSDEGPAAGAPTLRLLSPAAGAVLEQPAAVDFDAGAPLVLRPAGWAAGELHVHLMAGGTELMAGAGDLAHLGGTRYRWTLPRLPAGETELRLTWSGADHRAVAEGASQPVAVRLR